MNCNSLLVSFALIFLLPSAAVARQECTCVHTKAVYFGNGVGEGSVALSDAQHALEDMKELVQANMTSTDKAATCYSLAFNESAGLFKDSFESLRQILGNEFPSLIVATLLRINGVPRFLIPPGTLKTINDLLANEAAAKLIQGSVTSAQVDEHVRSYQNDIASGRKVVVVAHSQGNLFVNSAFQRLSTAEQASFAMIPVASPDSQIRRSLVGHVTFLNDIVIGLVQALRFAAGLPAAPLPNDFAQSPGTVLGHYFVDDYLADESAGDFIVRGVFSSLLALPSPAGGVCAPSLSLSVRPATTNISLAGWPVFFSGTVKNLTTIDQRDLGLQSWITQGGRTIPAGGSLLVPNGWSGDTSILGLVGASSTLSLDPFHTQANAGFSAAAGMVPGAAALRIELRQFLGGVTTIIGSQTFAVTLDRSVAGFALATPNSGSWISSPQHLFVVSYGSTVIYFTMVNTYDGSAPDRPAVPTPSANDGSLSGPAGSFVYFANTGQNKRTKLRFIGCNVNGCGPASEVYEYRIDLR